MFRGLQPVTGNMGALKSRRAMLDTLVRHLGMVRLSVGITLVIALSACSGLISGAPGGGSGATTPEGQAAVEAWTMDALPVFKNNCVACHTGQYQGQAFLMADNDADMRTALLNFNPQVVDINDPQGSRVLSKGSHEGPALSTMDAQSVLSWINAEKASAQASDPTPIIETAQFVPQLCTSTTGTPGTPDCPINYVKLDGLGLPGASIQFVAQALSTDLYITDLYTVASVDGVYLEHPLFTSFPQPVNGQTQTPLPDLLDRFYDVKLNLAASMTPVSCPPIGPSCDHIGAGASVFHDFDPQNPISISFKVLSAYQTMAMPPPVATGCDAAGIAAFAANVAPLMDAAGACKTCHAGQNGGATAAMPLLNSSGAAADLTSKTDNTACLAVRSHVNFQAVPQSGVLLAPDPAGDANHPFKLSTASTPTLANYQSGMNAWITVEASGQ
jgi:mono/diheme cytochrome c family protein